MLEGSGGAIDFCRKAGGSESESPPSYYGKGKNDLTLSRINNDKYHIDTSLSKISQTICQLGNIFFSFIFLSEESKKGASQLLLNRFRLEAKQIRAALVCLSVIACVGKLFSIPYLSSVSIGLVGVTFVIGTVRSFHFYSEKEKENLYSYIGSPKHVMLGSDCSHK